MTSIYANLIFKLSGENSAIFKSAVTIRSVRLNVPPKENFGVEKWKCRGGGGGGGKWNRSLEEDNGAWSPKKKKRPAFNRPNPRPTILNKQPTSSGRKRRKNDSDQGQIVWFAIYDHRPSVAGQPFSPRWLARSLKKKMEPVSSFPYFIWVCLCRLSSPLFLFIGIIYNDARKVSLFFIWLSCALLGYHYANPRRFTSVSTPQRRLSLYFFFRGSRDLETPGRCIFLNWWLGPSFSIRNDPDKRRGLTAAHDPPLFRDVCDSTIRPIVSNSKPKL